MTLSLKAILTQDVLQLINILKPAKTRVVGGAVRDALLGNFTDETDIDLATSAVPDVVIKRCEMAGIQAIPTGIDHGTVTAVVNGKSYEITTLREDICTDGRRAVVSFTENFEIDSQRRDFTFNALYLDEKGRVYDYHNGQQDLVNKAVLFIGDSKQRVQEDYLRILRYFRMMCLVGSQKKDTSVLAVFSNALDGMDYLSAERITQEFLKCLKYPVSPIMLYMQSCGLLQKLGFDTPRLDLLKVYESRFFGIFAKLFILSNMEFEASEFFIFSKKQRKFRSNMQKSYQFIVKTEEKWLQAAYFYGKKETRMALQVLSSQGFEACDVYLRELKTLDVPVFPVKGADVMALGVPTGPQVGNILKKVEDYWLKNDFCDYELCLEYLAQIINN